MQRTFLHCDVTPTWRTIMAGTEERKKRRWQRCIHVLPVHVLIKGGKFNKATIVNDRRRDSTNSFSQRDAANLLRDYRK